MTVAAFHYASIAVVQTGVPHEMVMTRFLQSLGKRKHLIALGTSDGRVTSLAYRVIHV